MRSKFDEALQNLNVSMIQMGGLCEDAIAHSLSYLLDEDDNSQDIDQDILHYYRDIEGQCLKLLLLQQPVARDLRKISTALKMITDMARIGNIAQEIATLLRDISKDTHFLFDAVLPMALSAKEMVSKSVDAYVKEDISLAMKIIDQDDAIDTYFTKIKTDLIERIRNDSQQGEAILDVLMVAKYLEKIGDHAVNIADWVIFCKTGHHRGE